MQEKRILIIDDEDMHLYTAKGLLESRGYHVVTYKGAFGATNFVRAADPNLVLLDINMPALSGDNLIGLIKPYCEKRKIPILFYSSNDEAILRDLVLLHRIQGYVCKGDTAGLFEKVRHCLLDCAA